MSTDEKHQTIGKLVSEHHEAKREHEVLKATLRILGQSLYGVAGNLKEGKFELAKSNLEILHQEAVDLTPLVALLKEWEEKEQSLAESQANLAAMGISV